MEFIKLDELKVEALQLYFKEHVTTVMKYKLPTVERIISNEIHDVRADGYWCGCGKITKKPLMGAKMDVVRFTKDRIYICHSHYDGCSGWD